MNDANLLFNHLNEEQLAAVNSTATITRVIAGPGTGKTTVLIAKLLDLVINKEIAPWKISAITFSNKAAHEIKVRLIEECEKLNLDFNVLFKGINISTYHAWCSLLIRFHIKTFFLNKVPINFTVASENDTKTIIKDILLADNLNENNSLNLQLIFKAKRLNWLITYINTHILRQKNNYSVAYIKLSDADVAMLKETFSCHQNAFGSVLDHYLERYQTYLKLNCMLDFSDLITLWREELLTNPALREKMHRRYRYLLLDEFQDTNIDQYDVVKLMLGAYARLFVVGDGDQSIYAFRGSEPAIFTELVTDFQNKTSAIKPLLSNNPVINSDQRNYKFTLQTVILRESYRATQVLLDSFARLISNNPSIGILNRTNLDSSTLRSMVDLSSHQPVFYEVNNFEAQGRKVIDIVKHLVNDQGLKYKDIAVLARTNHSLTLINSCLNEAEILTTQVGNEQSFLNLAEIEPLVNYFKIVVLNNLFAIQQTLNVPTRKFGPISMQKLRNFCVQYSFSLADVISDENIRYQFYEYTNSNSRYQILNDYAALIAQLKDIYQNCLTKKKWYDWFKIVANMPFYQAYLNKIITNAVDREKIIKGRLKHFYAALKQFDLIETQLNEVASNEVAQHFCQNANVLNPDELNLFADNSFAIDSVTLMTIHRAKGLEFKAIIVPDLSLGMFPRSLKVPTFFIEEERRVFYVAISRAKQFLYLLRPIFNYNGHKTEISPFLNNMNLSKLDCHYFDFNNNDNASQNFKRNARMSNQFVLQGDQIKHIIYGRGEVVNVDHDKNIISVQFKSKDKLLNLVIDSDKWYILS